MTPHLACRRLLIIVLGMGVAVCDESLVFSQAKKEAWEVLVAYEPDPAKAQDVKRIALRPNVAQGVYLYLRNAASDEDRTLEVRLVRRVIKGRVQQFVPVAVAKMEQVDFTKPQLVKFEPAAEPAKKDAPPPAPLPALAEGPPFEFQLMLVEKGQKTISLPPVQVTIQQPHEYLETAAAQFDKKRNRLSVRLKAKPDAVDPPCQVELVLKPQLIPGLIPPERGLLTDQLDAMNRDIDLFVENIQFTQGSPPKNGRIYVTVDRYERAFLFKTTFDQGDLRALDETRVRVKAPRYFNPKAEDKADDKGEAKKDIKKGPKKMVIAIEADGTGADKMIDVALDRSGEGRWVRQRLFPGLREQTLAVSAGPDGSAQFKSSVRDWQLELDTTGIFGKRLLRVQILDRDQRPVELADEQAEKLYLFSQDPAQNHYAPLRYDGADKAVYAEIVVDASGPAGVEFVELPEQVVPGKTVLLKATAKKRDAADQAPISKVLFFVGDPPKEPGIPGVFNKSNQLWQAEISVPADAKEKLAVTVRAITATGLPASSTSMIALQAGGPEENSKITGAVNWDGKLQAATPVTLKDAKGKLVASKETDKKGIYVFPNVAPGKYVVAAALAGMLRGTAPAAVTKDKGETIKADISLKRAP